MISPAIAKPHAVVVTEQVKPGGKLSHVESLCAGLELIGWRTSLLRWSDFSLLERAWVALPNYALNRFDAVLGHRWQIPQYTAVLERRLRDLVRREGRPTVLSLQETYVVPVARKVMPDLPIVLTAHGPWHREVASGYGVPLDHPVIRWIQGIERDAYLDADAVVSVDRAHAEYVREFGRKDRTWVIPNAVDTRRFRPDWVGAPFPQETETWIRGRPILFCARVLVPKNGVNVAVDAARLLRDRGVDFVLLIAGYGPQRKELDAQVLAARLEDHVRFLGAVTTDQMPGWCARASVAIVPSVPSKGVEEATSISAIEGQACGRPVVASDLGGLREVITHDVNGLLTPPGNAGALADAVQRLLSDRTLAKRLGDGGAENVRSHHSLEVWSRRFEEVFHAAANPLNAPPVGSTARFA
jgi:glycosyltransferase involved in cell wall biosynthesis